MRGLHVRFFTRLKMGSMNFCGAVNTFENGFNEFLWCCSHMILKYVKKIKGAINKNGTWKRSLTLCRTLRLP